MNGFIHWFDTDRLLAIAAIGALVVSIVTTISVACSSKRTQVTFDKSAQAAADSALTARTATEYFRRMADALEASLSSQDERVAELLRALPNPRPAWGVRHERGGMFTLTNIGDASAYDVEVTCANAVRFDGPPHAEEWAAGSAKEVFAVGSWQTGTPILTVSYRDTAVSEIRKWDRLLPPQA